MREALNEDTLFATIAMARQNMSSLILVVEGDDDHLLLSEHHNPKDLLIVTGNGRRITLGAAALADKQSLTGVRFLIDLDFDGIALEPPSYPPNVFVSTHHDLFMDVMLAEPALLRKTISIASKSAAQSGTAIDAHQVSEMAFHLAYTLVPFRISNDRQGLALNLAKFPFGKCLDARPSVRQLAKIIVERSGSALTVESLVTAVQQEDIDQSVPKASLIGDHDMFRSLSHVLRQSGVKKAPETLFSIFLAGVRCAHIMATAWFSEIMIWGRENSKVPLRCPCAQTYAEGC